MLDTLLLPIGGRKRRPGQEDQMTQREWNYCQACLSELSDTHTLSCVTVSVQARAERSCTLNKGRITCCNIAAARHCEV